VVLSVEQNRLNLRFSFGPSLTDLQPIGGVQDSRVISSNKAGGFIGPFVGMYASGNGIDSNNQAFFDWFEYESLEEQQFEESDGLLIVEAEKYTSQDKDALRHWTIKNEYTTKDSAVYSASGSSYIQVLPDTRRTHDDPLIPGVSFSGDPGKIAVLTYKVKINNPGKYYVWVRAFSRGTEDNGLHVGIDGKWPESGKRMQWCKGKHQWTWESKQRTKEQHCGVPQLIYLNIEKPGNHIISFSMREDGFAMDQWAISKEYEIIEQLERNNQK
jgi:hypothetical protein